MGISLDVSNSWKNYKSEDIKINVSSLINNVKEDFSNGINNAKQSWNNASTMVVDLSQEVGEKFDISWDIVKSSFSSATSALDEQVDNLETGAEYIGELFSGVLEETKKKTYEVTNDIKQNFISFGERITDKDTWEEVGATIIEEVHFVLEELDYWSNEFIEKAKETGAEVKSWFTDAKQFVFDREIYNINHLECDDITKEELKKQNEMIENIDEQIKNIEGEIKSQQSIIDSANKSNLSVNDPNYSIAGTSYSLADVTAAANKINDLNQQLAELKQTKMTICSYYYQNYHLAELQPYDNLLNSEVFKNYTLNDQTETEVKDLVGNDFDYLTEDQYKILNYLYQNEGKKEAKKYYKLLESDLNNVKGMEEAYDILEKLTVNIDEEYINKASSEYGIDASYLEGLTFTDLMDTQKFLESTKEKYPNLTDEQLTEFITSMQENANIDDLSLETVANYLGVSVKGFKDGVDTFASGLINCFDDGRVMSQNEYASQYILTALSMVDTHLDDAYQISTSIGNMAVPSAVAMVATMATNGLGAGASAEMLGSLASKVLFFSSTFGNAKHEKLVSGSDKKTALQSAFLNATSEVCLEYVLGTIPGLGRESNSIIKNLFGEGFEELIQEYYSAGVDAYLYGTEINLDELNENARKSFIYGCLTSYIMNGAQNTINFTINGVTKTLNASQIQEAIKEDGTIDYDKLASMEETVNNVENNSIKSINSLTSGIAKNTDMVKRFSDAVNQLPINNLVNKNSEKGGFDAVYGRGADKARYDDSMARIREIEDILTNTDDVSSSVKNADDVVEILDDVTEPVKDVDIGVKNINSQDKNIKIAEQILDQNSEQTLLEVSKHLDDNDIKEVLACLSPEEIARELETANNFEYVDIMKKLSYDDKINVIYEQAKLAANGEYNAFFINFREHAALHTNNVRDYAVDFAKGLENVNLDEIYYGAQFHDFGMKNSGLYWNGEKYLAIGDVTKDDLSFKELTKYIGDSNGVLKDNLPKFILDNYGIDIKAEGASIDLFPDDIIDEAFSNKIADLARSNHPVNSAVTVLTTGITPEGVDEATVALLAMSHSKSTSGIQDFSNVEQWKKCIEKLGKALEADGTMSANEIAAITKKLDELVGDGSSSEFKRLVNEAIAIRDGDAMSALALTSNGDTIMQTGNYSHVEYTGKAKLSDDYSEIPLSKDEEIDGIVDIIHDAEDTSKTIEVKNRFSKKTHAGELNVRFDSDYDGDVYYSISKVSDPTSAPYSTLDSIFERAGEVATYGNCSDRIFEIELPKAMEDTALGNWYKKTVDDMASEAITTATDKGNFSIQLDNFYNNCIKVVFR